jgi:CubicO group peptidase (beta-lactamase class C family)
MPAEGGLWTTAADLARFAVSWRSVLPDELAREAVTAQAAAGRPGPGHIGLGWNLGPGSRAAGHPGGIPGASVLLVTPQAGDGRACVAFANRRVLVEPLVARVLYAVT